MPEFEPRLEHLARIWWLRTWRGFLFGLLAVAPFAIGFVLLQRAGIHSRALKLGYDAIILVIGGAIAFWISRTTLAKRYGSFRIVLLPHAGGAELALTNRRVIAFWWFIVWRVTLGAALFTAAGELAVKALPRAGVMINVADLAAILSWEFYVLRAALARRYPDFRIALMTHAEDDSTLPDLHGRA